MNQTRVSKYLTVLFSIGMAVFVLRAKSINIGYQPAIYSYLSPALWFLLALFFMIAGWSAIRSSTRQTLFFTSLLSVVLLFLPNFVTGPVYGPDSYLKLTVTKKLLLSGHFPSDNIYPGARTFTSTYHLLTGSPDLALGLKLAAALLGPVSMYWFGKLAGLTETSSRLMALFGVLTPLGFGVWLTTRSTYHPYFLAIPLLVLGSAATSRISLSGHRWRWKIAAGLLLFGVCLYHPLLFLAGAPFGVIVAISRYFDEREGQAKIFSLDAFQTTVVQPVSVVLPLTLYLVIYQLGDQFISLWEKYRPSRQSSSSAKDEQSPKPTEANGSSGAEQGGSLVNGTNPEGSSASEAVQSPEITGNIICLPNPSTELHACGVEAVIGKFFLPLLLFGVATALIGVITLGSIIESLQKRQPLFTYHTVFPIIGYGYVLSVFAIVVIEPVTRIIVFRLFPLSSIIAVLLIIWFLQLDTSGLPSVRYSGVVFFVGVLGVGLLPVLFGLTGMMASVIFFIVAVSVLSGGVLCLSHRQGRRIIAAVLIVTVAVAIPALYPTHGINAVTNQPGTVTQHAEVEWIDSYQNNSLKIATNHGNTRIHTNSRPRAAVESYIGSYWLLQEYVIQEGEIHKRGDLTLNGKPVQRTNSQYILLSPFDRYNLVVVFEEDGQTYRQIRPISPHDFRADTTKHRIYDGGDNHVIFLDVER